MKKTMKIQIRNKKKIIKILIKKISKNKIINKPIYINLAINYKIKFTIFGKIDTI